MKAEMYESYSRERIDNATTTDVSFEQPSHEISTFSKCVNARRCFKMSNKYAR